MAETRQISTLLYCLGEEGDDVLSSTSITEEQRKKYDKVLAKFNENFKVRQNIIFEWAKFNKRVQLDGKSSEQYITAVHHLAETCNFGNLKEDLIRLETDKAKGSSPTAEWHFKGGKQRNLAVIYRGLDTSINQVNTMIYPRSLK